MDIIIKKPTEAEKKEMQSKSIWECGISEFEWNYDMRERCLLEEGEVTVEYAGGSKSFSTGDYVIFPKGMHCIWKVIKPVKKFYEFD